jgi:hypothetical protein
MAITRKNAGGIISVPVKAESVINAGGFVLADSSGYAVPGSNLSGGKFIGIAVHGVDATGLSSGDVSIKVYRQGLFKMLATSILVTMQGANMYCNGAATFDDTTSNLVCVGKLVKFLTANLGWIDIADSGGVGAQGTQGIQGIQGPAGTNGAGIIACSPAKTTSREENLDGLTSAMALANDLKLKINAHAADAGEHLTHIDDVNFPVATATATDLVTLKALAGALLTAYAAHHTDSRLASAWAFHVAQGGNNALVSAVTPTTLQECVTRLNDLKTKYDLHDDDDTAHETLANHAVAASNAAYGTSIKFNVTGAQVGDALFWEVLDDGTGNVTKVPGGQSVGAGFVTLTFSADPQNDCIVAYYLMRNPA